MKRQSKGSFHRLQDSQTFDDTASYMSKIFFVRYAEEQISIRDFVKFRTEVDVQPGYLQTEFFLKCELYYSPPPQSNYQHSVQDPLVMREEIAQGKNLKFRCVQTRVFQINKALTGLSTFVPISFDREFTCICVCSLHGSLIDFRFRNKNYRSELTRGGGLKDGDTFMENGILVELKFVDVINEEGQSQQQIIQKSRGTKWSPNNVAEYFFFDDFGFLSINEKKIRDCYQEFTEVLRSVYEKVRSNYNLLADCSITEEDLNRGAEFSESIETVINMKGLENYFAEDKKQQKQAD